ncbi:MAG: HEAT repeat domain-containing protein [Acidobacteria bacterium]|nr:HEAT repeat domain-containing protein [Acidobacteriota bacterium]
MVNLPPIDVVILTVLPEEFYAVCNKVSELGKVISPQDNPNLYSWSIGRVEEYTVAVGITVRSGTNKAVAATLDAIQRWEPHYVFFVGVAGGFPNLEKGQVVIANVIHGYEYGKINEEYDPRSDQTYRTNQGLLSGTATHIFSDWERLIQIKPPQKCINEVFIENIASGDKVVDNPSNEFFDAVLKKFPKVKAVEMEGAGAALAIEESQALGKGVGFMMIRGISDQPRQPSAHNHAEGQENSERGTIERDKWKLYAADTAAAFTISYISSGLPVLSRSQTVDNQTVPIIVPIKLKVPIAPPKEEVFTEDPAKPLLTVGSEMPHQNYLPEEKVTEVLSIQPDERPEEQAAFATESGVTEVPSIQPDERLYCELLLKTCDIINLANLPEPDRHLAQKELELRRLYVPLRVWVEPKINRERGIEPGSEQSSPEQHFEKAEHLRLSIGECLTKHRRLVVLGDPGAGKTTFVHWMATAYLLRLKNDPDWQTFPNAQTLPDESWLPIIVRCGDLNPSAVVDSLEDILQFTLRKAELSTQKSQVLVELLRTRLKEGQALLILDGLDEITDTRLLSRVCGQLKQISEAYPQSPIIVTSRIVGYREMRHVLGGDFQRVTLADLLPEEKDDFARRWFTLTERPEHREIAITGFIDDIHSSNRIERLTGNPMLLTTMALVKRKVGKLPSSRVDLYREAVQVLLNWRSEVGLSLNPHEAIPQLEFVAYAMCDRGVQQLRRDEILSLLRQMRREFPNLDDIHNALPNDFLKRVEARTGLLVEIGTEFHEGLKESVYKFRHLTFQEYLAARALVYGRFPGRNSALSLAENVAPLAGRIFETALTEAAQEAKVLDTVVVEAWQESLRLCVSIYSDNPVDQVDQVLLAILTPLEGEPVGTIRARAMLAASCLADEPNVSEELAVRVIKEFVAQVKRGDGTGRLRTGIDLAAIELTKTRWKATLFTELIVRFKACEISIRPNLGGLCGVAKLSEISDFGDPVAWLFNQVRRLDSPNENEVIEAALGIMEYAFENEPVAIAELEVKLLAKLSENHPVAYAAAWALQWSLIKGFWEPTSAQLNQILDYISNAEADPGTVRFLAWILGKSEVFAAVEPLLFWINYPYSELKKGVIGALAYLKDPQAVEPLILLLNDESTEVRQAAISALGEIGDKLATEPLLDCLENSDKETRLVVLAALGKLKDPRAIDKLLAGLQEIDIDVNRVIVEALGQIADPRATEPLFDLLVSSDGDRNDVAHSIVQIGEPAVDYLLARLNDAPSSIRPIVANLLGRIESERAIEPLLACLDDDDLEVRHRVIEALGLIGKKQVIEPIRKRLKDEQASIRTAAARALFACLDGPEQIMVVCTHPRLWHEFFLLEVIQIDEGKAKKASETLQMPLSEFQTQFEALAGRFDIKVEWANGQA